MAGCRLVAIVMAATLVAPAGAGAWFIAVQPLPNLPDDGATAVAMDADAATVVVGHTESKPLAIKVAADGKEVWRAQPSLTGVTASAVAVAANRDVLVAIGPRYQTTFRVMRLAAATGAVLWDTVVTAGAAGDRAEAIAVDPAGDVLAVGALGGPSGAEFAIVKLDGDDGAELWRYTVPSSGFGIAHRVAVDDGGNALASGQIGQDVVAAKVAALDGSELWRYTTPIPFGAPAQGVATAIAIQPSGDAFAAMSKTGGNYPSPLTIVRLDGSAGTELWRYASSSALGAFGAAELQLGADGHPIGSHGGGFGEVVKVQASDGSELWQTLAPFAAFALDAQGDVLGYSNVFDDPGSVVKLSGATGATVQAERFAGINVSSVAFGPAGFIVAGRQFFNGNNTRFTVLGLRDRLAGRKLLVRDPGDPAVRKLRLVARDGGLALPFPGTAAAPDTAGALLEIANPVSGETAVIPLPAARWTARESQFAGGAIYKFVDRLLESGPCSLVVLKGNRALKAKCDGTQLAFTLDEPMQDTLDVRVSLTNGFARCLRFGGAAVLGDETGQFIAKNAAPPASCPGGL